MTASCHPMQAGEIQSFLAGAIRALCDRPGESPAQRDSRTSQLVHMTLGFEPRDGLEYMLATMILGNFELILDSMREVFQDRGPVAKQKTRSGILALSRAMLSTIRDLRVAQKRPVAAAAARPKSPEPETVARTLVSTPPAPPKDRDTAIPTRGADFEQASAEARTALDGLSPSSANPAKTVFPPRQTPSPGRTSASLRPQPAHPAHRTPPPGPPAPPP